MIELLKYSHEFAVQTQVTPTKGNLVYEYNPFRNLRIQEDKYEYNGQLYSIKELNDELDIYYGCKLSSKPGARVYSYLDSTLFNDEIAFQLQSGELQRTYEIGASKARYKVVKTGKTYYYEELFEYWTKEIKDSEKSHKWFKGQVVQGEEGVITYVEIDNLPTYEKGTLVDFITDQLNFSLENPVMITPQYSYDGSVNLILNDGINTPRLVNTRFSTTGKNTYEVVDRNGDNDSNIYDEGERFDIDTSLYKRVQKIPKLQFQGTDSGGNLKVGNYHFYFRLSDADGNETDFVAESGLVSVFIGFGAPNSLTTGTKNENSYKSVRFLMSNLDTSYDYVYVYYSRYFSEGNDNYTAEYIKVNKKFLISNAGTSSIVVSGFENNVSLTASDINLSYNIVDSAKAQAVCQNMLFLGNVHKPNIPYKELQDLSLHFLPYAKYEIYKTTIDQSYNISTSEVGYFSPKFIYEKTGYWGEELYRIGVVYILPNGELTPVFNIRGATNIYVNQTQNYKNGFYSDYPVYEGEERCYISYDEDSGIIHYRGNDTIQVQNENAKGVIRIQPDQEANIIYGLDIRIDAEAAEELKKYVSGYFFVRQSRIPTILAQGITIGIDRESRTPTIPTAGGVLDTIRNSLSHTHVQTENINGVNYISEGFLERYSFKFKKKHTGLFKRILTAIIAGIAVVAVAAACVFTAGAAGAVAAGVAGAMAGGASAVGSVAGTIAGTLGLSAALGTVGTTAVVATTVGAAAGAIVATAGAVQEIRYATGREFNTVSINGRDTQCPSGYEIKEQDNSRKLSQDFNNRIIIKDQIKNKVQAILCPDYEINQEYFNQIFTGNTHRIGLTMSQGINGLAGRGANYFSNQGRHFYIPGYYDMNIRNNYQCNIVGVPGDTKCVGLGELMFRSRAGEAEEAHKYEFIGDSYENDNQNKKICSDIIRGSFGPYLAIDDINDKFSPAETVNIYIPNYSETDMLQYVKIRMDDNSVYNAISDRIDMKEIDSYRIVPKSLLVNDLQENTGYKHEVFRGDCYICQFTHRVIRNFNDPSAPYNDEIVDANSWRNNYDPDNTEKYSNINLGDVNAIQLGMWVTFTIRSSNNLNIRTLDSSNVDEQSMCGHPRGYYPYLPMSIEGAYKVPESSIHNKGFSKSLSERWNNLVPDVPYIKNWFGTRIMYSDIHTNDAYRNGFRTFQGTHYRDYTRGYGEIVKLISLQSNLLCVFEHGIALIAVNERALAGEGAGGNVYINTSNVLPENPKIISDVFGSQWPESVLKAPGKTGDSVQYVYGVDTVAKKIWRTDGNTLTCISDFRVQEFLNNNITLGERELTPKIGIRNVKTVYNAFKRDVLFTFYDNTYGFEEKVWNLCWNELLEKFITFYSWVPSHMENINNIPFSFDRNTTKWLAKLGTSHSENSFADGITLSNVIIENTQNQQNEIVTNFRVKIPYIDKQGQQKVIERTISSEQGRGRTGYIGLLSLSNRVLPDSQVYYTVSYSLQKDQYGNHNHFEITPFIEYELPQDAMFAGKKLPLYALALRQDSYVYYNDGSKLQNVFIDSSGSEDSAVVISGGPEPLLSELYYRNKAGNGYADDESNKIAVGDTITETIEGPDGEPTEVQRVVTLSEIVENNYPIFRDKTGKRLTLPRDKMINPDKIVTLLNIKASITIQDPDNSSKLSDDYYNMKAEFDSGTSLIDAGCYESVVAIAPRWNLQFLSSDFWKHGQAGIIDTSDIIYPTYWYGKQHPFEFECVVVNDPSLHKIFTNLEIIANKAKPESFHYEIIGETYDFAKDKANMYFRQEAMKALWQYNGADITYNRNFLNVQTRQQPKSADFPHRYYTRQDTINDIEDYYIHITYPKGHDYSHLSGAEIVYYPNRQEYRIWNHAKAVCLDELSQDDSRSIIAANCQYLEDRWKVTINPILVCYKNEYEKKNSGILIRPENSTWTKSYDGSSLLPPLPIYNSPIPDQVLETGIIKFPGDQDSDNALSDVYDISKFGVDGNWKPLDLTNWLDDVNIYKYNFGEAQNRKEIDLKDKFLKVRIRYSGEELAIIDFLNTVYRISYS